MNALGLARIAPLRQVRLTLVVLAVVFASGAVLAGTASAEPDHDGDGHADDDCAPLDPAVHPSAVDKPDLTFEDMNCDGIDGDESEAIFVAADGDDTAAGTRTSPMRTVAAAVAAAAAAGTDVYIAGGAYETEPAGGVPLADGVGLYGGYEPITGARSLGQVTTIEGSPQALLAEGDTGVVLQLLNLEGAPNAALSAYGLRAVADGSGPSRLALSHVRATGAAASGGAQGSGGARGVDGAGLPGGAGGAGGCGSGSGAPGAFGTGFGLGAPGADGANAAPPGASDAADWPLGFGATGGPGGPGGGGRGGSGGDGGPFGTCGGRGGTGGSGGGGGGGGAGGQNGGGSFGIYIFDSSAVVSDSTLTAGNGGTGGDGGLPGDPGAPTSGSPGAPGGCSLGCADAGFSGGLGFFGGRGGGGGGGAGGPSFSVYQAGLESGFAADAETALTSGSGGRGGFSRTGAGPAPNGESAPHRRSATAPEVSTADFDADGVSDPADACPDQAGGGNGCPVRPAKVSPPTPAQPRPAAPSIRDTTPPSWTLSTGKAQRALKSKAITFSIRPSETCTLTVVAKLGKRTLARATRTLPGETTSKIKLKLGRKALGAFRKAFSRRSRVAVTLAVTGVDTSGNATRATKRLQLKR